MTLSVNLYAKERRGATLIITKRNGQQIEGELIAAKPNSLLLLNTEGKDEAIDIADIKVIRIVKKTKVGLGAGIGFASGASFMLLLATAYGWDIEIDEFIKGVVVFGSLGALLGVLLSTVFGTDFIFKIEGMTDQEIQEALDYLRKKACVRDYK